MPIFTETAATCSGRMRRYAPVAEKYPREVVLLRTQGCFWKQCAFCDYYSDSSPDENENVALNREVLAKVTGKYGSLQVIDSASVFELPPENIKDILELCESLKIREVILETHFLYRDELSELAEKFRRCGVKTKYILGLETFDADIREDLFKKGIGKIENSQIAEGFAWANFLYGFEGQTLDGIMSDIRLGLKLFERITLSAFIPNTTKIKRDNALINEFYESNLYKSIKDSKRVEILDILDSRAPDLLGGVGYDE